MKYEELANEIGSITGIVLGILFIVALILMLIYLMIYIWKWTDAKKEYLDKLPKEERQVINDYLNYKEAFSPLKKRNNKQ